MACLLPESAEQTIAADPTSPARSFSGASPHEINGSHYRRDETGIEPLDDKLDPGIRGSRQIVGDDQASFVFHVFLKGQSPRRPVSGFHINHDDHHLRKMTVRTISPENIHPVL
jgi:hypothetical protein